jgi:hypothetical protein
LGPSSEKWKGKQWLGVEVRGREEVGEERKKTNTKSQLLNLI